MIVIYIIEFIALIILIIYILVLRHKHRPKNVKSKKQLEDNKIVDESMNSIEQKSVEQKRIDLHYYKSDFSFLEKYYEFSFYVCFYDVFNVNDNDSLNENSNKGNGVEDLFNILEIDFDFNLILTKYMDRKYRDIDVFQNKNDEMTFVYLDLEQEPTDQSNMFFIGVSCSSEKADEILSIMNKIYNSSGTKSEFKIDKTNSELYYKIFHSFYYLYDGNFNKFKKQIIHH
jgi:hypothetical protein